MVNEIDIKNYKSVQDLKLELRRFNVLIGANGSGKSNILEAITFGGAAAAYKLDNEFLVSRGIRITNAKLTKSAFADEMSVKAIEIIFSVGNNKYPHEIIADDAVLPKWTNLGSSLSIYQTLSIINQHKKTLIESGQLTNYNLMKLLWNDNELKIIEDIDVRNNIFFSNFLIYSPEISSLRKLEEESQIQPIGIKGEGLFNVLQIFNESYEKETIEEIKHYLHMIDWFDDFEAIADSITGRKSLVVKDKYLPNIALNQNNVNEGFLFLLFYISLLISKETPAFFAIDNIEASFHPRLCEELIKNMVKLAKKHDKQIILTTHNPFVLDGLNLDDEEQRLYVVRRNADGETIADKIEKAPPKVKLSEAWMRGYIGGQPETIN